jgi:hypothetical protein
MGWLNPLDAARHAGTGWSGPKAQEIAWDEWLYNQHLPQKALNHQTPVAAMKKWQESHPYLFKKRVANHPGPDS